MRSFIHGIKLSIAGDLFRSGLIFERVTAMFRIISKMLPDVEGCEYLGEDIQPGSRLVTDSTRRRLGNEPVRHEDMQALSFSDSAMDFVLHSDVLEHVPDPDLGLRECARVLRPGGIMLFACPIYATPCTRKIAELRDGKTTFLGPSVFHGDPLNGRGVPVYNNFGFDLFDRVRKAGFSKVEIGYAHDTVAGYFSDANPYRHALMWHILCRATK
jgi:SAM-dependent methyltransferase